MTSTNKGVFSYPGVSPVGWLSFSFTDWAGISPAIGLLKMVPQLGFPDLNGNIVLTYNNTTVVLQNCHIDAIFFERGSGGKILNVRFFDERWAWKDRSITGNYNFLLPNGWVDPLHEADPQTLVSLCFQALGVQNYDVSALPLDARPIVDWDHANAAEAAADICDQLGCRIVPQRSTGAWVVCFTGVGNTLPNNWPYRDPGDGIDPQEVPDYIKIVSAPIDYQMAVRLEAVGRDRNLGWQRIDYLKYAPDPHGDSPYGFDLGSVDFASLNPNRFRLPDGTVTSDRELALQTICKCFRIRDTYPFQFAATPTKKNPIPDPTKATITVPGYPTKVFRKQMILSNRLVTTYVDAWNEQHTRPAFISGLFWSPNGMSAGGNFPFGKRIDSQVKNYDQISEEDQTTFSLSLDEVDSDRSIITLSQALRYNKSVSFQDVDMDVPQLWLTCAVNVRDLYTWQPVRNEFFYQIGNGTDTTFCRTVIQEDVKPYYVTTYLPEVDANGDLKYSTVEGNSGKNIPGTVDNSDEVAAMSLYYAQQIAQTYITQNTSEKTYLGIFPLDMDGAVQQISYSIGGTNGGTTMRASLNTEHDWRLPGYDERRQRDGRHNIIEKMILQKEIGYRRAQRARGGVDT